MDERMCERDLHRIITSSIRSGFSGLAPAGTSPSFGTISQLFKSSKHSPAGTTLRIEVIPDNYSGEDHVFLIAVKFAAKTKK